MTFSKHFNLALRSLAFNFCGLTVTACMALLFLPFLLLPRAYTLWIPRVWISSILFLLKHITHLTFEIQGPIPQTPSLIASKHQSTFETLVFHKIFKKPVYFLKQELLYVPILGWYFKKAGMIPVKRHRGSIPFKALQHLAQQKLSEGHTVIIFPEGTRTSPNTYTPYKTGIALFYQALNCPVVPVALNSGLFWGRRSFLKYPGRIIIEFLPPILPGLMSKAFMAQLESEIETKTKELMHVSPKA